MDLNDFTAVVIFISVILGILALVFSARSGSLSGILLGLMIPVVTVVSLTFGPGVASALFGESATGPTRTTYDLRALSTATAISGSGGGNALIASATIDEKAVYRFYQEDKGGGITLRTVDAADVTLYEDGRSEIVYVDYSGFGRDHVEIHVPAGAVAADIDVSLPN